MQGKRLSQAQVCHVSGASLSGIQSQEHQDQIGHRYTNGSKDVCCAPMPIGTDLETTPAHCHQTLRPRAILGCVVESLLALLIATGFEPVLPASSIHAITRALPHEKSAFGLSTNPPTIEVFSNSATRTPLRSCSFAKPTEIGIVFSLRQIFHETTCGVAVV